MTRRRFPALVPLALCLLPAAAGQTGAIRGPVSGVVYDGAARAIRPVIGIPGAAYLGPAAASGIDFARIAPDGRRAVVLAGGTLYFVRGLRNGELRWRILEQRASADRAAWSPDSRTVAVWSADQGRLRVWTGLTDEVAAADHRETRGSRFRAARRAGPAPRLEDLGAVDGSITALAVDGGGQVVYAVPGGLYLARGDSPASLIAPADEPVALVVVESALFVADRARDEILEIRSYDTSPDITLFAGPGLGVDDPVALAVIDGGRTLLAAEAQPRRLEFFDVATRARKAELEVSIQPTRLAPLGERFWLLNDRVSGSDTLYVLDSAGRPAVYFIPAGDSAGAAATPVED